MMRLARRSLASRAPGLVGPEVACVAVADWLFWDHGSPGLSVPLFCSAVAVTAFAFRIGRGGRARGLLAVAILALALAPAMNRSSPLAFAFAVLGTALGIRVHTGDLPVRWVDDLRASALLVVRGPVQIVRDLRRRRALMGRRSQGTRASATSRRWRLWVAPVILFAVFLTLLASANPLISSVLLDVPLNPTDLLSGAPRAAFWLVVLVAVWPAIRLRRPRPALPPGVVPSMTVDRPMADDLAWNREGLAALLLSPDAVLRTFLILDVLFSVQIALDGAYLWGGRALPQGVSYAGYAHRGAYPLVLTALLAAVLVLVVRRPGGPARSRAVSALLAVFLVQNVVLVASAMQRLDLYVAAYGLTEWRVAAFAWMALVLMGLVLIGLQGALGRGNRWLVARCLLATLAVLYAWCFIDVPGIVADYDVAHCSDLREGGPTLDAKTIRDLGVSAIPAVDRFVRATPESWQRNHFMGWRARQAGEVRRAMADWRGWSVEDWRLSRYLDRSGVYEPVVPAPSDGEDG